MSDLFTHDDIESIFRCSGEYIFLPWFGLDLEEDGKKLFKLVEAEKDLDTIFRELLNMNPDRLVMLGFCSCSDYVDYVRDIIQEVLDNIEEYTENDIDYLQNVILNVSHTDIFVLRYWGYLEIYLYEM
jgi:hypothetical protein